MKNNIELRNIFKLRTFIAIVTLCAFMSVPVNAKNNDSYDNWVISDVAQTYNNAGFYVVDLEDFSKYGLDEFTFAGKSFKKGFWATDIEHTFECYMFECSESDFDAIIATLDIGVWEGLNPYYYVTMHDKGEPYYTLFYNYDEDVMTLSWDTE
ncbi:MAG: hypothetical protein IKS48_11880 [Eubacterium sp.]|nr:hypothetical protein [Eubacterium sp.]